MFKKKKETLRAAVLASIFAMSVCGSAWAYDVSVSSNVGDSDDWKEGTSTENLENHHGTIIGLLVWR